LAVISHSRVQPARRELAHRHDQRRMRQRVLDHAAPRHARRRPRGEERRDRLALFRFAASHLHGPDYRRR
jgi:hypothetical protein